MSFVGLRIAGTVAVLSTIGALGATVLRYSIERADARAASVLSDDLSARTEAGRLALAAITEADTEAEKRDAALAEARKSAAFSRARELVALGHTASELSAIALQAGERLQLVETAAEEPNRALVLGPVLPDSRRLAASVPYDPAPPKNAALGRALGAIVNLAEAPRPFLPPASELPYYLGAAVLTALAAFAFAHLRIGRPISTTLDRARALAHGDGTRAEENRGSRDARELARAVNALVDRAERLKSQGRAARDEDISSLVRAIEDLARGELAGAAPRVGETLEPLSRAIERAAAELVERIRALRQLSGELAARAAEIAPSAKKIGLAAHEQAETLAGISQSAADAATEVLAARDRLAVTTGELQKSGADERRMHKELRAVLLSAARRLDASRLPANGDVSSIKEEMRDSASALEALAASLPESPAGLSSDVTQHLHDAASGLLRIAEQAARGVRTVERAAHASAEGTDHLRRAVAESAELAPRLQTVIAGFAIGTAFETEMLERLERWQKEAKAAASAPDGLTEEGRASVRRVLETSENARARLSRLVSATESAIDVLRG